MLREMTRYLLNNKMQRVRKYAVTSKVSYYSVICPEGIRKIRKLSVAISGLQSQDLKAPPPEYESGGLSNRQLSSVVHFNIILPSTPMSQKLSPFVMNYD